MEVECKLPEQLTQEDFRARALKILHPILYHPKHSCPKLGGLIVFVSIAIYIILGWAVPDTLGTHQQNNFTTEQLDTMSKQRMYKVSLFFFAGSAANEFSSMAVRLIQHLVRYEGGGTEKKNLSEVLMHMELCIAYTIYLFMAVYATTSILRKGDYGMDGKMSWHLIEYLLNTSVLLLTIVDIQVRILLVPEVYSDIRLSLVLIITVLYLIVSPMISRGFGITLMAMKFFIELSFCFSLYKYNKDRREREANESLQSKNVPRKSVGDDSCDGSKSNSSRTDRASSMTSSLTSGSDEHSEVSNEEYDMRRLHPFFEQVWPIAQGGTAATKEWYKTFLVWFKNHCELWCMRLQILVCVIPLMNLCITSYWGLKGTFGVTDPMDFHWARIVCVYSQTHISGKILEWIVNGVYMRAEGGLYQIRKEADVSINLLCRILPPQIVEKVLVDLNSVPHTVRRSLNKQGVEKGNIPIVCNDFVARRVPAEHFVDSADGKQRNLTSNQAYTSGASTATILSDMSRIRKQSNSWWHIGLSDESHTHNMSASLDSGSSSSERSASVQREKSITSSMD